MNRTLMARQMIAALGACFAVLLVVGNAAARPDEGTRGPSSVPLNEALHGYAVLTPDGFVAVDDPRAMPYLKGENKADLLPQAGIGIPFEGIEASVQQVANNRAHENRALGASANTDAFMRAYTQGRNSAGHYSATRTGIPDSVIPYLSQGQGITRAAAPAEQADAFLGSMPLKPADEFSIAGEGTVIPYLSQGILTADDARQLVFRSRPDGYQPQLRVVDSGGFDWEATGVVAGSAFAALLLGLMSMIALRELRGPRSA